MRRDAQEVPWLQSLQASLFFLKLSGGSEVQVGDPISIALIGLSDFLTPTLPLAVRNLAVDFLKN